MQEVLLAGLSALAGLVIGRLWDARSEVDRWRRDQRVASYRALAEELYSLRESIRTFGLSAPRTPGSEAAERVVRGVGVEWNKRRIAVWMHGSRDVARSAAHLDRLLNDLYRDMKNTQITAADWDVVREPTRAALDAFLEAVRRDLDLESLDTPFVDPRFR